MENTVVVFENVKDFQNYLKEVNVLPFNINRDVDKRNGISLRNSILEFGIQSDLVLVETKVFSKNGSKELYMIEGQHRRVELLSIDPKKIKGTPTIRINKSENIEEIINLVSILNSAGKKWNLENYAKAWANSKSDCSKDYQKLIDFKVAHGITINSAVILIAGREAGNTSFKLGKFKFKKDDRVNAILEVYETAISLGLNRNPGSFKALVQLYSTPKFSVKNYINKVRLHAPSLRDCRSADRYYEVLK